MKKIVSFVLAMIIISSQVIATTASVQKSLDNTKAQLNETKNQLKNNQSEQKSVLGEIATLDQNINTTENQIEDTKEQIKKLEEDIVISEENIAFMEKEYEKKYELRKERVNAYYRNYRNSSQSMWNLLDGVSDPTEKVYLERVINNIIEYDDRLLAEIEAEKLAIEDEKERLENVKVACDELKASLEVKLAGLNEKVEIKTKYMAKLQDDQKLLEESIDEITKKADELEAELRRIASSSSSSKYTGGTMKWPLPGYYTITSQFGNRLHPILHVYKLHTGVDIAGAGCNGKNVVAAADGTVITAGWISGYGYTVMIDHGGGIVTLYAHSQKLLVKKGDKVKAGQAIMLVGTTGNSTGPHLHFEVRVDGKYVNPLDGWIKSK